MMQQPIPGQPPQPPTAPAGGTGAAQQMRPMLGQGAQSLSLLRTGVEALQKSLVGLPMGSELHTAVLKAVTDISRRISGDPDHAAQVQALAAMSRDAQQNPQQAMLQKMFQGGPQPPGASPMPGGAPPMGGVQ